MHVVLEVKDIDASLELLKHQWVRSISLLPVELPSAYRYSLGGFIRDPDNRFFCYSCLPIAVSFPNAMGHTESQTVISHDSSLLEFVSADAKLRKLAGGGLHSEGSVFCPEDENVIWSDVKGNRPLK